MTACFLAPAWAAPPAEPPGPLSVKASSSKMQAVTAVLAKQSFQVEVALEPEDFYRGLMYRTVLPADQGMLFPFFPPRAVSFWMKNTLIPLDMIFIRDRKVQHIVQRAQPCKGDPCKTYPSEAVVDMVIELPAGSAKTLQLKPGDDVSLYSDKPLAGEHPLWLKVFPKTSAVTRSPQ